MYFPYNLNNVILLSLHSLGGVLFYPDDYHGNTARFNCNSVFSSDWGRRLRQEMDTCFAKGKRKLSDVSDSNKIKLSENNDHRPKLKSRKHENGLALGCTANVVGTKKQKQKNLN